MKPYPPPHPQPVGEVHCSITQSQWISSCHQCQRQNFAVLCHGEYTLMRERSWRLARPGVRETAYRTHHEEGVAVANHARSMAHTTPYQSQSSPLLYWAHQTQNEAVRVYLWCILYLTPTILVEDEWPYQLRSWVPAWGTCHRMHDTPCQMNHVQCVHRLWPTK